MKKSISKKFRHAFTLVELVVVIAIIAILSAVSVGAYYGITQSAKNSVASQEGDSLKTALIVQTTIPFAAGEWSAQYGNDGITFTHTGIDWTKTNFTTALEVIYSDSESLDVTDAKVTGFIGNVAKLYGTLASKTLVLTSFEYARDGGSARISIVENDISAEIFGA